MLGSWDHGRRPRGLVGILSLGRVLRSSAEAVQVAPHDDVFSFYAKATQDVQYEPSKLDFISELHHGTKSSAGVVVGGFMGTPHHKSKSSSTVHEGHLCKFHALVHSPSGDKRWAGSRGCRPHRSNLGSVQPPTVLNYQ